MQAKERTMTEQRSDIAQLVEHCNDFFLSQKTKSWGFRVTQLKRLQAEIRRRENDILTALYQDLHKSRVESFMTELGLVYEEIDTAIKRLKSWMRPKRVRTPLGLWAGKSRVMYEPFGTVLIMSPWNYPFNLTLMPLVGAIAAGNCAVVKPSNYSLHTTDIIEAIITAVFPPEYVCVIKGGREENANLLDQRFDYIFFTGGETVGRRVMQAAAKNLTPLTLELGGKSPCIIAPDADILRAAKRILFGKFLNAGQTCVAPDYLLLPENKKAAFFDAAKKVIAEFFPTQAYQSMHFPHIISEKHFDRIMGLIDGEDCVIGGTGNKAERFIEPTILDNVNFNSPVMMQEIFGPVLPVISYTDIHDAVELVKKRAKPLALYLFTTNAALEKQILNEVSFGGGAINDTVVHLGNANLPFGGVGMSGMGKYHGYESFLCFSNKKSIYKKHAVIDVPLRYHPHEEKKLNLLRFIYKAPKSKR